jgi:hypothetical protein
MITLTTRCDVPTDRIVTLKLPEGVEPGMHELIVQVNELSESKLSSLFDSRSFSSDSMQLAMMADDPSIQHEIGLINKEFLPTENDGLEGI